MHACAVGILRLDEREIAEAVAAKVGHIDTRALLWNVAPGPGHGIAVERNALFNDVAELVPIHDPHILVVRVGKAIAAGHGHTDQIAFSIPIEIHEVVVGTVCGCGIYDGEVAGVIAEVESRSPGYWWRRYRLRRRRRSRLC